MHDTNKILEDINDCKIKVAQDATYMLETFRTQDTNTILDAISECKKKVTQDTTNKLETVRMCVD